MYNNYEHVKYLIEKNKYILLILISCLILYNIFDIIICVISIMYPTYCAYIDMENGNGININIQKYGMLLGIILIIDNFLKIIINNIPGIFYLKIILFYFLIKNNFLFSGIIYDILNLQLIGLKRTIIYKDFNNYYSEWEKLINNFNK